MSSLNKDSLYRSFDELENNQDYLKFKHREFQEDASVLETPVSRRSFLKLMGATAMLAGASGCSMNFRKPVKHIYPYAKEPEHDVPDKILYFATSTNIGQDVIGLLAKSREGRPIKIEGNPSHPNSLGATSAFHQASILDLYDPDRQQQILKKSVVSSKSDFESAMAELVSEKKQNRGKGLCLISEYSMSPTFHRVLKRFKYTFPEAKVVFYEPVNNDNSLHGIQSISGKYVTPDYRYDKASVIVSFDSDYLGVDQGSLISSSRFADSRDPELNHHKISRSYVFEPSLTLTGSKADHRFAVKGSEVEYIIYSLVNQLLEKNALYLPSKLKNKIADLANSYKKYIDKDFLSALVDDVVNSSKKVIFVIGPRQPEFLHSLVFLLNNQLSSSKLVSYFNHPFKDSEMVTGKSLDHVSELCDETNAIDSVICLGANPVYDFSSNKNVADLFNRCKFSAHLTISENETSRLCKWVVPRSHYLESWSDLQSLQGVVSVVQPSIEPLYESYQEVEILNLLLSQKTSSYDTLRTTWRSVLSSQKKWESFLHHGFIQPVKNNEADVYISSVSYQNYIFNRSNYQTNDFLELAFASSLKMYDGRFSNNGWLQELPDPITKLTWDNSAIMSINTAKDYGLKAGDILDLLVGDKRVQIVVNPIPGHVDNSMTVEIGFGRQVAGRVGERKGFDVNPVRFLENYHFNPKILIKRTDKVYELASTQNHGSMEDRALFRSGTITQYKTDPKFARNMVHVVGAQSLWEERPYDMGNQWGMAIDLSRCTGCNACVVACQAENNIPIVGKSEVLNGREMHWLRVDRYFEGEGEHSKSVHQPMTCLHCENAPCEQVCPVAATVHGEEGTNDMVYNRCVGTRYCSDNCPTKVRRFNYFDYHQRNPQSQPKKAVHFFDYKKEPDPTVQLQFNPQVTVRMRGVMEKCTFCIQRIMKGKSDAANQDRDIIDGEVKTACQQVCPSNAIVFGNILDETSEIKNKKSLDRDYTILDTLHLKARLSYSCSISNPNEKLSKQDHPLKGKTSHEKHS